MAKDTVSDIEITIQLVSDIGNVGFLVLKRASSKANTRLLAGDREGQELNPELYLLLIHMRVCPHLEDINETHFGG